MVLGAVLAAGGAVAEASALEQEKLQLRIGRLLDDARVAGRPVADPWLLARVYERRDFIPAWGDSAKLDELLDAVADSTRQGLLPGDYHVVRLNDLVASLRERPDPALAVELELLATDALARLAFHLRFGKVDPEAIEPTWNFSRQLEGGSPARFLNNLMEADDLAQALDGLAPDSHYYLALKRHLQAYRDIAAAGGWPIVESGETLRIDMVSPRVATLRARLAATGDWVPPPELPEPERFDADLEEAVRRFQVRHGLDVDGAVGRRTLAVMNVPVSERIDQIRVNLERFRWVFRDLEPRFLLVNIARFRVVLIEDQQVVWATRAVVGRPYRQTPVFKARMTYLELNPTWTVPPTILREDLLPELRRDPATLQRRNMVVEDFKGVRVDPATIDWAAMTARNFPYLLRQQPGPDNALGRVKLMYPNPYHVYMHDTPARDLFQRSERTFSSGCIRLEKPLELAEILLAGSEWDAAALQRALDTGRTRVVNLPTPITVLTLYATTVPQGEAIHFAADVYGRDARLLPALDENLQFSPPAGFGESMDIDD